MGTQHRNEEGEREYAQESNERGGDVVPTCACRPALCAEATASIDAFARDLELKHAKMNSSGIVARSFAVVRRRN